MTQKFGTNRKNVSLSPTCVSLDNFFSLFISHSFRTSLMGERTWKKGTDTFSV